MNRILLLCPDFFEYKNLIIKALNEKQVQVDYISLTFKYNLFRRILRKISPKLIKKIFDKKIYNEFKKIKNLKYQKVVVIFGGDFLSKNHIKFLKDKISSKFIFYAWDSMANYTNILDYVFMFDRVFTFDKEDSVKYGFEFMPLFYSDDCLKMKNKSTIYDYCFIGTMALNKASTFNKVYKALPTNLKGYEYFYFSNFFSYFFNKIFHSNEMKHFNLRNSHFIEMKYSDYLKKVEESKVILDVARKKQNGLTIRTIESLAASKKIITTNENISSYEFYNKNNIIILGNVNDIIDLKFFEDNFDNSSSLPEKYNIHQWVDIIFEI